ncbi:TPA: tryptophan--tRNA ligase, partial [Candidatus Micrarchaeota archaeon]|nr:tryptophan--tRNA ligase [Candidatus Micrarchaeota archaeon]
NRLWRRGIVFAHRDFDKFLNSFEKGKPVAVMSGIKPTGDFHLGSKLTVEQIIYCQKAFSGKLFYCIADLEAFADNGQSLETSAEHAIQNTADLLALGMDERNALVYKQSENKAVSNLAFIAARKTTLATLDAIYGHQNLGLYFSALMQSGDILQPQLKEFGGPKHVVIPVGIDQDPHIRLCRDLAQKIDPHFLPPAATYQRLFRSLDGTTKMSKRDPLNVISLNDEQELIKKKVMRALTGGRATAEEQKRLGGEIEKCVVHELMFFHFQDDDMALKKFQERCTSGGISCGDCKKEVAQKICSYLKNFQERKKKLLPKARKMLEKQ